MMLQSTKKYLFFLFKGMVWYNSTDCIAVILFLVVPILVVSIPVFGTFFFVVLKVHSWFSLKFLLFRFLFFSVLAQVLYLSLMPLFSVPLLFLFFLSCPRPSSYFFVRFLYLVAAAFVLFILQFVSIFVVLFKAYLFHWFTPFFCSMFFLFL